MEIAHRAPTCINTTRRAEGARVKNSKVEGVRVGNSMCSAFIHVGTLCALCRLG